MRFLLNRGAEPVALPAPGWGLDLLTGRRYTTGEPLRLDPCGVVVLRMDSDDECGDDTGSRSDHSADGL